MGKIFISHSSANNAEALAIHDWLAAQGWDDVFLDLDPRRGLVAGDRWQAALKAAAEQCELILILISPDWAKSKWCLAEFLLAKQMNKQILGVVVQPTPLADLPVELTAEWQLVDLSAPDAGWSVTLSPPRYAPETTVSFSGTGLARLAAGLEKAGLAATSFNWPPAADLQRAPYRGLLPLDGDDAGIFFGRDGAIVLTLDALRGLRAAAAPRFATILGASGAGKSSFLRAGLLPRLGRDSRHFYVLPPIRPGRAALTGEHGFAAMLEASLKARNIIRNRADLRAAIGQGAGSVAPLLRLLAIADDAGDADHDGPPTLVIAVDQAEELLSADNAEASAFLTLLADLGKLDDPAVLVLLTVRSDSFDALQSRPEIAATQPHHLIDLPPVPAGSFGDIIRGPARRVAAAGRKLVVEEALVDALLTDIEQGGTKDALPLLAFTLERLYSDYGADGDLKLDEYDSLGRIHGAIEAAVDQALGKADANPAIPRDRAARLALLRRGLIPWLAGIDPDTGSPRRRVARLAEVPAEARPLIELMVEQRLLATDIDKATGERTIEPAHEALLRQWGALDGWLVEDSADLGILEALRRAATDWDANARRPEYVVHTGARLATAAAVADQDKFAAYLTSVDRAYLDAARAAEAAALHRARALRARLTIAAAIAGIVVVAGLTAGWFIWSAGEAARTQSAANFEIARSEAALREGRPEQAAKAAMSAYELLPSTETRTSALTAALSVSPHAVGVVGVEGRVVDTTWLDPSRLAVLGADGKITLFDASARTVEPAPAIDPSPLPIALAPDGKGSAVVIRADTSVTGLDGKLLVAPPTEPFAARSGRTGIGANGRVVVFVGLIGDVLVRDWRQLPVRDNLLAEADAPIVGVTPDGTLVGVARSLGVLALYNDPGGPPTITSYERNRAESMAWSYALDVLAVSDGVGQVSLLDAHDSRRTLTGINTGARSAVLQWSPAAALLATACFNNDVCIYNTAGSLIERFSGHIGPITSIHWSPDGRLLASTAAAEPVRIWSLAPDASAHAALRSDESISLLSLAVDPANGRIAVGNELGRIGIWTGEKFSHRLARPEIFPGVPPPAVTSLAFLSDGRLAAVYKGRGVAIWTPGASAPDKIVPLENLGFSRIAALTGDIRAAVPLSDKTILVLSGDELRDSRVAADSMPL